MRRPRSTALHCGAAAIAGALLGFVVPHLPEARATGDRSVPAVVLADDSDKSTCKCEQQICSSPDGTRNIIGQCAARCHEGQVAECKCGKCTDEGHIDKPSACHCRNAE
jgi:hypothetical protein